MTGLHHPLVQDYLARLDRAAAGLPPEIRAELVADLSAHLDSALTPDSTDADVRNALQELGAPEAVAAAAYDGVPASAQQAPTAPIPPLPPGVPEPGASIWPTPPPSPWGPIEIIAVIGLTAGTFLVPFVGPIVGLVMAWVSDKWTRKEKVIATVLCALPVFVLVIGGIGLVGMSSSSSSSGGTAPAQSVPASTVNAGANP
jgi:hypothetical protein